MQDTADALFERWCRRGDARALGELFDLLAPELLKLGLHLVGDAAAAEDLVQATFVAAIEQRERVDAARPVRPWLAGVLAHKAQQHRRREARPLDFERLRERAEAAPDELAEQREFSAELAKALDRLEEPYRQVLILRLRHGLEVADVAHVLGREPGTVRVQLHRGLEKLRATLPAALASALLIGIVAPRGLAAVRTHVMGHAAAVTALSSPTLLLGGFLVSKPLLGAALTALAVLALWLGLRDESAPVEPAVGVAPTGLAARGPSATSERSGADERSASDVSERSSIASTATTRLACRVVDAESGAALPGARVAWYPGRTTNVRELRRSRAEFYVTESNGRLAARTRADWPALIGASDAAFAGRAALLALDAPLDGELARSTALTDADGGFEIGPQDGYGILEVALEGYATRRRPCEPGCAPERIELWRLREFRGRAFAHGGELDEPVQLVLSAARPEVTELPRGTSRLSRDELRQLLDVTRHEGLGCWVVTLGRDGTFHALVGAPEVRLEVLTPGWKPRFDATYTVGGDECVFDLMRVPRWHFTDASTGAPIECVRVLGREQRNGYVRWSAELDAPGGFASPPGEHSYWASHGSSSLAFTAWAEGYQPASWIVADTAGSAVLEVPMQPGAGGSIVGSVLRRGVRIEGAEVALYGHSPLQWEPDPALPQHLVDASATLQGRFALFAPPGQYVLSVRHGGDRHSRAVTVPTSGELAIDLAHLAALDVDVVDAAGMPQPGHVVALRSDDGRTERVYADESGVSRFTGLPPGNYLVMAPHVTTESSFAAEVTESIELSEGARSGVRLTVLGKGPPRFARVSARGVTSYALWRARFDDGEWHALANDGTVPLELATEAWILHVAAPDGRSWSLAIPKGAPDGHVIELDAGEAGLVGILVGPDGHPLPQHRIVARPWRKGARHGGVSVVTSTDAAGHFALHGLAPAEYLLQIFGSAPEALAEFVPSEHAAPEPRLLRIQLPTLAGTVSVHGRVLRPDGSPATAARLHFEALISSDSGTLRLPSDAAIVRVDHEGRYSATLPRSPDYVVNLYDGTRSDRVASEPFRCDAGPERTLDLTLP